MTKADTSKLMIIDLIKLSRRDRIDVCIYKFFDIDTAINCYKNYNPGEQYRIKKYGNLVAFMKKRIL